MTTSLYKLSPSDFAFLWQECKRCFYLKVVRGITRPFGTMPGIFSVIAGQMHRHFLGQHTEHVAPSLPPGIFAHGEKTVHSAPIERPGFAAQLYIYGRVDAIVAFDDGTYGVVDFKTTAVKPTLHQTYARQLRAYAYALETPAPRKFGLAGPISTLGLIAYEPLTFDMPNASSGTLAGDIRWIPISRNPESFLSFLDEVLAVLDLPEPPPPDPNCSHCQYHSYRHRAGL